MVHGRKYAQQPPHGIVVKTVPVLSAFLCSIQRLIRRMEQGVIIRAIFRGQRNPHAYRYLKGLIPAVKRPEYAVNHWSHISLIC